MKEHCTCILIDDDEHKFFDIIVKKTSLPVECFFTSSCQEAVVMAENFPDKKFNYVIIDWILLNRIGLGCSMDLKQVSAFNPSRFIIYSMMPPPQQVIESCMLNDAVFF